MDRGSPLVCILLMEAADTITEVGERGPRIGVREVRFLNLYLQL